MAYLLLVIGFGLLIKGADLFVDGSSNIAKLLRISPIVIGLTIVSFGTSFPEATVSIIAALEGSADVSLGNVIGSNIFNITLIVGIAACIYPLKIQGESVKKEIPFALLASGVLFVLISDTALNGSSSNSLSRSDGIIFLLILCVFLYYVFEVAMKSRESIPKIEVPNHIKWGKSTLYLLIGLIAIVIGGNLVVTNGTEIALSLGMSETLVGLTIIAIGTSLPELVTSITAAIKKESEIAFGNIIGSNIFNVLFVLGASATITPLMVNDKVFIDVILMILFTLLLLIFSRSQFKIGKKEGAFLVIVYILYLVYIILRN